jgi:hypothetical protein
MVINVIIIIIIIIPVLIALAAPGAQGNLIDVEEGSLGNDTTMGQSKTQMLLEEEANIEQLQEREKSIRQLEVS